MNSDPSSFSSEAPRHLKGHFSLPILGLGLVLLVISTSGCIVAAPRYTSLDLALLPCEQGDSPVFFRGVEFDGDGVPLFNRQVEELHRRFKSGPPVTDLVLFIHGWNKNPSSAELDYQNFLCRLHARLRGIIDDRDKQGGLLVLGVFWPSTITNRAREPFLLLPFSYYGIRDRADSIAERGLAPLMASLTPEIQSGLRLHLIGHSFGGRMLARSLEKLHERNELVAFLKAADAVNVVLLNAALPPTRFDWISEAVAMAKSQRTPARFTKDTASYLFNVHSLNDTANQVLFRLASVFNDDPALCAAGACGVPSYATLCVDNSGKLQLDNTGRLTRSALADRLNAWNVDATRIVFDHSDIYKGRMASLIADLLYDEKAKQRFPVESDTSTPANARCVLSAQH
jgi:pimeloyl-ACP methyl ester carboxylesterase